MKNRFAVSTNTYHGFSLDEALSGISKAGFKYVELTGVRGWTEHVDADAGGSAAMEVLAKCKKLGLTPISLSGHCNLMDNERLNDFIKNIELAKALGCEYIVTSTGEAHFGHNEGSPEDILIANIKTVLKKCEELGIILVLEVHGEHGTGESLAKIVRRVGSQNLGVNYDTANVVYYGKKLPEDDLPNCIQEVKHVHLKDKAGEYGDWNFPAVGAGFLHLDKILKMLEKADNLSPISIEIEFTQKGPADLAEVDRAVKDSYDYLKGIGVIKV
jgi:L-ribulose-5-phosphate 3-epimerase